MEVGKMMEGKKKGQKRVHQLLLQASGLSLAGDI